ncbi:MAG TPA: SDR family oxidoreductase [Gemmatimonadales bacterium]|nr:SDR family oxidoreductase [Gemmatimonadales bacterium]
MLVSSTGAFVSEAEGPAYEAAKAAMIALVRSVAVDYGPLGVRANAICPGWVVTPMGDRPMEPLVEKWGISREEAYRHVTKPTPLRRPATAEEVASCCLFLACDESAIVTGTALIADCGLMATSPTGQAYGGQNRDEPTSTARRVRSSSQSISAAKVLHRWHAVRCGLPEAEAKPLDSRPEEFSHGGVLARGGTNRPP